MELPVHKHLIIRTEVNNPPGKDKQEYIKDWFRTLVKDIDMKLLAGPYCEYFDYRTKYHQLTLTCRLFCRFLYPHLEYSF